MLWANNAADRFAMSDEALSIARALGDPTTLARVLFRRDHTVATLESVGRRVTEAGEHLEAALTVGDELMLLQAMQTCASSLLSSGEVEAATVFGTEMMTRAAQLGLPAWQFNAIIGHTGALLHHGKLNDTMAAVAKMFSLGVQSGRNADAATFAADIAVNVARWKDELQPMMGPMRGIVENSTMNRQTGYLVGPRLFDGGDIDAARRVLDVAVSVGLAALPRTFMEFPTLTNLAYLSVRLNDERIAQELQQRLILVSDAFPCTTTTGPCGMHSLGILSALLGESAVAEEQLRRAAAYHQRSFAPLLALESHFELAKVLLDRRDSTPNEKHYAFQLLDSVVQEAARFGAQFLVRRATETTHHYRSAR